LHPAVDAITSATANVSATNFLILSVLILKIHIMEF
jgi:hypothetical protein